MTHTLDDFVRRRTEAAGHLDRLAQALRPMDPDGADYLAATARRARDGRFVVLLLGCFSSGKSTLLNAMLGQPVLPVKVNPCTAVLTEVRWAEVPSVMVRYRDGRPDRTLTVDAFLETFQLQASADDAAAEAEARFGAVDRAIVGWPLPLLRDGIVLVDTPGLDDDPVRTARTMATLPHADAVVVVLNATRFLTALERRAITEELLPLGLSTLFFPIAMADVLAALTDDPDQARADLLARAHEVLDPVVGDRFDARVQLVDSRTALRARWDRDTGAPRSPSDDVALARSGVLGLERTLERFLVHERGAARLAATRAAVEGLRADLDRRRSLDRATALTSLDELARRRDDLAPRLHQLDRLADRVARVADGFVRTETARTFADLRAFLADTEAALPDAIAAIDVGGLAGLDLLVPSGRDRVVARLRDGLQAWLDERLARWRAGLAPRIEDALARLHAEVAPEGARFDAEVRDIHAAFSGIAVPTPEAAGEPGATERWFSVAIGAAMLSPGAVAAGWSQGYEGALRGAAGRLAARLGVIALGALLGPPGWVGLVVYAAADAVLLVTTGGAQLARTRQQLATALQGRLVAEADANRAGIEAELAAMLTPVRDAVVAAARDDADRIRRALDDVVDARARTTAEASERGARWDRAIDALDSVLSDLDGP